MRIEHRAGAPALIDDDGGVVLPGDPLCLGNVAYHFNGLHEGSMVVLAEHAGAPAGTGKALVYCDDEDLYRGPSVADEVERSRSVANDDRPVLPPDRPRA